MIGAVGDDSFGKTLVSHLINQGINTENIMKVKDTSTGIASITLSGGDNSIIVVPGANNQITPDIIEKSEDIILYSNILLLQLEIPLESVIRAVELAKKHKILTILNPAPIQKLPKKLLEMVDYVTPNEHEQTLLVASIDGTEQELEKLKEKCILTKGSKGVMVNKKSEYIEIPSIQIEAVDTPGAGDSFNGALPFLCVKGLKLKMPAGLPMLLGQSPLQSSGHKMECQPKRKSRSFYNFIN